MLYEKDKDKYYILFKDSNNVINKVEVSLAIYDVFNCSELHDLKEMNEYDNHIEHLDFNEESIYLRSINKPISIDDEDKMYRKSIINGSSYYTYSKIKYYSDGTKTTVHKNVSEEEYLDNLHKINGKEITKTRYNFIYDGERYRMDFYHNPANIITLERDITSRKKKHLPPFIMADDIKRITDDRDYSEANICIVINEAREQYQAKELGKKIGIAN